MFLSFHELVDIVVMSLLLGFLFKDLFEDHFSGVDPLARFQRRRRQGISSPFWFSVVSIAPSIVLHELAHKFMAIGFGLQATLHAFYANSTTFFLGVLAIIAKLTGFGLVFLVPGFVSIRGLGTPLEYAVIAFAGPAVHGLFYLVARVVESNSSGLSDKQRLFLVATRRINGFLFVLNMLPIPGVDGFSIYSNLFSALF